MIEYLALENIKFKSPKGEFELHRGQQATLRPEMAIKLISAGRVKPIGRVVCRIYSRKLDDYLWICTSGKETKELIAEGGTEAIYTLSEAAKLMDANISHEALKKIHTIKKTFRGGISEIEGGENT